MSGLQTTSARPDARGAHGRGGGPARPGARRAAALLAALLALTGCGPEEVIREPEVVTAVSPFEYPVELWDRRVEGETILMLHVTETGVADSAYVHTSSGEAAFDSAALAGVEALRFRPARQGDRRIPRWARLPVRFEYPDERPSTGGTDG